MVRIREVAAEDIESICHIQQSVWITTYVSPENNITRADLVAYTKDWTSSKNHEFFKRLVGRPNQRWLVAEIDGGVIGHIRFLEYKEYGKIEMLYLRQDFQRNGIGSLLLEAVIQDFKQDIIVDVVDFNKPAIHFYKKHGFSFLRKEENNAKPLPSGARIGLIRMKRPTYSSGPR